jgi:hypothetical protein
MPSHNHKINPLSEHRDKPFNHLPDAGLKPLELQKTLEALERTAKMIRKAQEDLGKSHYEIRQDELRRKYGCPDGKIDIGQASKVREQSVADIKIARESHEAKGSKLCVGSTNGKTFQGKEVKIWFDVKL